MNERDQHSHTYVKEEHKNTSKKYDETE